MNYITAEQFLKLPKDMQKVFISWWNPQMYDLFFAQLGEFGNVQSCIEDNHTLGVVLKSKGISRFPLFRLDQLGEFIKTRYEYIGLNNFIFQDKWNVKLFKSMLQFEPDIEVLEDSLLRAFWEAAILVAKENLETG